MVQILVKNQIRLLDFDLAAYEDRLDKDMREEIKAAARDWLSTVLSIVPVWSRGSHATFKPLADAVGFAIPTQPLIARKDRSDLGEGVSRGGITIERNRWAFFYETDLRYLAFNEFNSGSVGEGGIFAGLITPTPYNFTRIAGEQFDQRVIRYPNPFRFLKGRPV